MVKRKPLRNMKHSNLLDKVKLKKQAKSVQKAKDDSLESQDKPAWYDDEGDGEDIYSTSDSGSDEDEIDLTQKGKAVSSQEFTFDFSDMKEEYNEGITLLLKPLIKNPSLAFELADKISKQSSVGTAIVNEGEIETFAFATILPLINALDEPTGGIITQLASYLTSLLTHKSNQDFDHAKYLDLLSGSNQDKIGILLHGKFSNLPLQLIAPLHQNLYEDLTWAKGLKSNSTESKNPEPELLFQNLEYLLVITSVDIKANDKKIKLKSNSDLKRSEPNAITQTSNVIQVAYGNVNRPEFHYYEDEVYYENSSCCYCFECPQIVHNSLAAIFIDVNRFQKCVEDITNLIS